MMYLFLFNYMESKQTEKKAAAKQYNMDPKKFWVFIPLQKMQDGESLKKWIDDINNIEIITDDTLKKYADAEIIDSTSATFENIEELKNYQTIPLLPYSEKLENIYPPYQASEETGCCFYYQKDTPWNIFAAIIQASENFQFSYDWKQIIERFSEA
jgi:hypothetical protein